MSKTTKLILLDSLLQEILNGIRMSVKILEVESIKQANLDIESQTTKLNSETAEILKEKTRIEKITVNEERERRKMEEEKKMEIYELIKTKITLASSVSGLQVL